MSLNVKKLLNERMIHPILPNEDALMQTIRENKEDTLYYISVEKYIKQAIKQTNYSISAIFDLANPFANTDIRFCLVKLTKSIPENVKTSVYNGRLLMERADREAIKYPQWKLKANLLSSYQKYMREIEQWENKNILPKNTEEYSFNTIDYSDFDKDKIKPQYYTKEIEQVKQNLSKEPTVNLIQIAEILSPKMDNKNKGKVLLSKYFKYPINYADIPIQDATGVELKKGDIVIKGAGQFGSYLVSEVPSEKLYAGNHDFVVRLTNKKYAPEYLQMYLNSDLYKELMAQQAEGVVIPHYTKKTLSEIKIIVPTKEKSFYEALFKYQISPLENKNSYNNILLNKPVVKDFETTFQLEQIRKLSSNYNQQVQEVFDNDMKEVEACFKAKAYKATLILCGSILEAFLLDWLNELQPEEQWLEKDWIYDKKNKKDVHVGLNDYINKIEKIKRPNWMEEANKAHEIQKQRNLVHAKLCLKDDLSINKDLCEKVIQYLIEVIHTRAS